MFECPVCIHTRTAKIVCDSCLFESCEECYQHYFNENPFKLECMKCRIQWDPLFMTKQFSRKTLHLICTKQNEIQKKRRETLRLDEERIYLEIKKKRQQKHQLEKEIAILKTSMAELKTRQQRYCPYETCGKDFIVNHHCLECKRPVCDQCFQPEHQPTECDKQMTQNLKRTKSCPVCKIPIYKEEGCYQMFCTFCFTGFDWGKEQVLERVENPHFYKLIYSKHKNMEIVEKGLKDPKTKKKWRLFQELMWGVQEEKARLEKPTQNNRKQFILNSYKAIFQSFLYDSHELVEACIRDPEQHIDNEIKMMFLIKKLNDECFSVGEKWGVKPPRVFGWKLVWA